MRTNQRGLHIKVNENMKLMEEREKEEKGRECTANMRVSTPEIMLDKGKVAKEDIIQIIDT